MTDWRRATLQTLRTLWIKATECQHSHAPLQEGKLQCPTCNETLVGRWILVRCTQCNRRQEATYVPFFGVVSLTPACEHCGCNQTYQQPLEGSPAAQHLPFAMLIAQPVQYPVPIVEMGIRPEEAASPTSSLTPRQTVRGLIETRKVSR